MISLTDVGFESAFEELSAGNIDAVVMAEDDECGSQIVAYNELGSITVALEIDGELIDEYEYVIESADDLEAAVSTLAVQSDSYVDVEEMEDSDPREAEIHNAFDDMLWKLFPDQQIDTEEVQDIANATLYYISRNYSLRIYRPTRIGDEIVDYPYEQTGLQPTVSV